MNLHHAALYSGWDQHHDLGDPCDPSDPSDPRPGRRDRSRPHRALVVAAAVAGLALCGLLAATR